METMIEVQDLTKYYGPQLAVSRLDFQVAAGEIVGFLGPNGAGKTTTLKILAGFLAPSAGTARINGHDCVTDSLAVRRSLGYVPENVAIYPDLTVTQFLRFAARAKGVEAKAETGEVDRVVAACGLEEVRGKLVAALSKGFRQRLGLAQALINQPPLLILDEPTIGLDPSQIVEIRQLIKNLEGGPHGDAEQPHPAGGEPVVPPGDHHQPGPDRGQRHPGKPLPATGPGFPGADDGGRTG